MINKVLIVEDQFVEANDLQLMLAKAGYIVCGIARSVPIAREIIKNEQPDLVLLDIFLKGDLTGIDLARELNAENIPFIFLSANSNEEVLSLAKTTQPAGFIVKPYREKDLLVTLEIARYRFEHGVESYFRKGMILNEWLRTFVPSPNSFEQNLLTIVKSLQPHVTFDYLAISLHIREQQTHPLTSFLRIAYDEYQVIGIRELQNIVRLSAKDIAEIDFSVGNARDINVFNGNQFVKLCTEHKRHLLFGNTFQLASCLQINLSFSNGDNVNLCLYSRNPGMYNSTHIALLDFIQKSLAACIERIVDISGSSHTDLFRLQQQTRQPTDDISNDSFEYIIGKSHLLLNVFEMVAQVAPSDTSVLILGESGTGKERIADSIHNRSKRKNQPFVKINCAALPATLIESELFGHEKGSFTGATNKRIGKFEKADKGTIFLDEIGEMPLDLQVKLLRVLQERYIESIGGKEPVKVDVRIITATNRNLEKEVAEGRFRLDLYYRLNVFPIELPPLRERREDIPELALHFIKNFNRKTGKQISGLSDKVLKTMMAYHWPGNIRELENAIERSVLLTKGPVIEEIALMKRAEQAGETNEAIARVKTIHENERDYIISVLRKCHGKIWGTGGAAEILNLPPSTLKSKMKKLGIGKDSLM